jgi:hypothetical protein
MYMTYFFKPIFVDLITDEINCPYYRSTGQHILWASEYSLYGEFLMKNEGTLRIMVRIALRFIYKFSTLYLGTLKGKQVCKRDQCTPHTFQTHI